MIAIDTNVLVRYSHNDGDPQRALAIRLIDDECSALRPGFVSQVVLAEFAWVYRQVLKRTKAETLETLRQIMDNPNLSIQQAELVEGVLDDYARGRADFADYLIAAVGVAHGAVPTLTFDRVAACEPGFSPVEEGLNHSGRT